MSPFRVLGIFRRTSPLNARVFLTRTNPCSQLRTNMAVAWSRKARPDEATYKLGAHVEYLISSWGKRRDVCVVVIGDAGTGKSSLINAAAAGSSFSSQIDPILPPIRLPCGGVFRDEDGVFRENTVTILDTSSRFENKKKLQRADAVVLTYACDQPESYERLGSYWFPELIRLEIKAPVILAACKGDILKSDQDPKEKLEPLRRFMVDIPIENCIICSARSGLGVHKVFYSAQKAVFYPTALLFDTSAMKLKGSCSMELAMLFYLCDHDDDGLLNKKEWEAFQVKCFNTFLELSIAQMEIIKKLDGGHGLTLHDFWNILKLCIINGVPENVWTVLMTYRNVDTATIQRDPDQSVELKSEAIKFLEMVFHLAAADNDVPAISSSELDYFFPIDLERAPSLASYADAVPRTKNGLYCLDAFLSMWRAMALLKPEAALEWMLFLGYDVWHGSAFQITRKRILDRKMQQSDRNVFQCYVFGPEDSEKSVLMNSFIQWQSSNSCPSFKKVVLDNYWAAQMDSAVADTECGESSNEYPKMENLAVNNVEIDESKKALLVLREILEERMENVLSQKESLAACDVAIFLYDSSDRVSFRRTADLLLLVASHGEASGFEVPCLIIAVEKNQPPDLMATQDSEWVCQYMGIEAPIVVGEANMNSVFGKIVKAAKHPHENIPNSKALEHLHEKHF